jgi:hypothetical protein
MPDRADEVLSLAIGAAGPAEDLHEWSKRVLRMSTVIAAMFREGARERAIVERVMNASVFRATYRGYRLEPSTTRLLVSLETQPSKDHPDGVEEMRTDRTDELAGQVMRDILDSTPVGSQVLVWKAMEQAGPDRKVRVLVHIAPSGHTPTEPAAIQPTQHTQPSPRRSQPVRSNSGDTASATSIQEQLETLTAAQRVAVVKSARKFGIDNIMQPAGRQEEVLAIIADVKAGRTP